MSSAVVVTIFALLDSPDVVAIVGQDINPDTAEANAPSIAVQSISDDPTQALRGPTNHWNGRVSLQIRTRDADTRHALNIAVRRALSGRTGTFARCRCRFTKASTDVSRWSDDASIAEQVMDWYVSYSVPAGG